MAQSISWDTRIILDLAGIVSFYDTTLAPSLVDIRADQERCDHRIENISSKDIERVRTSVSHVLERSQDDRSGVDRKTLFRVIVDRYSDRFDLMDRLLNSTSEGDSLMDQARKVRLVSLMSNSVSCSLHTFSTILHLLMDPLAQPQLMIGRRRYSRHAALRTHRPSHRICQT